MLTDYVNDPSGLVLAVYHGRQMKRRVFMYPVEYRAYGPDGINVVYERENYGVNAGQWVKRYLTTDYQGSVLQAHDVNGDHEQHYELFGAEKGQVARRTGWLDREIDWETSPLSDLYRTVDLVNRKYDPQRATFLTSDPLWMMSADASSYHYGYHDPMNMIDPWGLDGQKDGGVAGPDKGGGGGGGAGPTGPSGPKGPRGTPTVIPWDFLYDILWSNGMHEIGGTSTPGGGYTGGGLGPVGGSNGANGKTDALPSSSKTGTGESAGVPYKLGIASWQLKTPWMDAANSQIGVKEDRSLTKHSPEVMKYHKSYPGGPNNDDDETGRWCGSFVYWCLKQVGIQGELPNPARSQNWKDWGQDVMVKTGAAIELSTVPLGSVVILYGFVTNARVEESLVSHIGFATGRTQRGQIQLLGGNQGSQVKKSYYSASLIVAVRFPVGYLPATPIPLLNQSGDVLNETTR